MSLRWATVVMLSEGVAYDNEWGRAVLTCSITYRQHEEALRWTSEAYDRWMDYLDHWYRVALEDRDLTESILQHWFGRESFLGYYVVPLFPMMREGLMESDSE